jgi:hypothetical protein
MVDFQIQRPRDKFIEESIYGGGGVRKSQAVLVDWV